MSAELYVKRAKAPFDIIFCDPPFPYKFKWELVKNIAASPLMREGSRLLLHRPREDFHDEPVDYLAFEGNRHFGRSIVDFFRYFKPAGS
jgi:16S rRNA G966 N2-methylase RsmD